MLRTTDHMKNAVFWIVTPCGFCKKRRFGRTYLLHHLDEKKQRTRNVSSNLQLKQAAESMLQLLAMLTLFLALWVGALQLLVTANVFPSSRILFTLIMEAILSSETSVLTRSTRRYILEDGILHSHRRENLKFDNWLYDEMNHVSLLNPSTPWASLTELRRLFYAYSHTTPINLMLKIKNIHSSNRPQLRRSCYVKMLSDTNWRNQHVA
jgi:hypothetical protein